MLFSLQNARGSASIWVARHKPDRLRHLLSVGNYAGSGFVLRSGRSLEAGGIEPPSVKESLQLLRACSVIYSRCCNCRQTSHYNSQRPRKVSLCLPGHPATKPACYRRLAPLSRYQRRDVAGFKPRELTVRQQLCSFPGD